MKIKKQHRRKKFNTHVNRKRMRNKQFTTGTIMCKTLKEAWKPEQSTKKNMKEMGLAMDPNKVVPIPNNKKEKINLALLQHKGKCEVLECNTSVVENDVVQKLESEAHMPRERRFKLPKGQVEYITYLLDKYGHDYKSMAKDRKNYYQETWKQLRAKVKTFMGIPQQYSKYLADRGLLDAEIDEKVLEKNVQYMIDEDSD